MALQPGQDKQYRTTGQDSHGLTARTGRKIHNMKARITQLKTGHRTTRRE
jgi:hypothetical protein